MEVIEMSYLVISKISKAKEFFADMSDFSDKVNELKTPEVDLLIDNAMITGDLLSRTYGFSESGENFVATISSNWLSQETYEKYHSLDPSVYQIGTFESKGYEFDTILP
jgi:hypothetical protein